MKNRIWIELDAATSQDHAGAQCVLANAMISKLGDPRGQSFFWMPESGYCWGGEMGYETLPDRGRWFNLDYLAL